MNRKLKNILTTTLVLTCTYILLTIVCLICFLFLNFENDAFTFFMIVLVISLTFSISIFAYITLSLNKIVNKRKTNDLKSSDIIGGDIQEAYNYGQLGMVIIDDNKKVIWVSDYLVDQNFNLLDHNIEDLNSELEKLISSDDVNKEVEISFEGHYYKVKYIKPANLFIFKDVSEEMKVRILYNSDSPVVGSLVFDNYQDVSQSLPDDIFTQQVVSAKQSIQQYFREHGCLIREIRNDTFLFITTKSKYDIMYSNDKFSIVDKVRSTSPNGLTISIGISYGAADYQMLAELSANALDVALSRGGDQVVVGPVSSQFIFIGGKTEPHPSHNKVKLRSKADSLITLIKHSSNVIICGHKFADFDAIGACLGLKEICDSCQIPAKIIFEDNNVETKARRAIKATFPVKLYSETFVNGKEAEKSVNPNTLFICVDCNSPSMLMYPQIINKVKQIAIVDHHRPNEDTFTEVTFNGNDTSSSSTSEIITFYVSQCSSKKITISKLTATFLLAGILLDTNHYRTKTTNYTYDASSILKGFNADNEQADEFLKEDLDEYQDKVRLLNNTIIPYYGILVCKGSENEYYDSTTIAITANDALSIKGVQASFVIAKVNENTIRISARSDGSINCQYLLEKMGGGGHFTSAATQITSEQTVDDVYNTLNKVLYEHLDQARNNDKTLIKDEN